MRVNRACGTLVHGVLKANCAELATRHHQTPHPMPIVCVLRARACLSLRAGFCVYVSVSAWLRLCKCCCFLGTQSSGKTTVLNMLM